MYSRNSLVLIRALSKSSICCFASSRDDLFLNCHIIVSPQKTTAEPPRKAAPHRNDNRIWFINYFDCREPDDVVGSATSGNFVVRFFTAPFILRAFGLLLAVIVRQSITSFLFSIIAADIWADSAIPFPIKIISRTWP